MLLTFYILSCVMLSVLARRATNHLGNGAELTATATTTTTRVSVVSSSQVSPNKLNSPHTVPETNHAPTVQTPTNTPHSGFTEPSSCTDARRAAVAMDLRHSPNAPLFPADWPKGCREIQDSLKQIADAFLPTAYLPKERFNEVARRENCRLDVRVRGGSVVLGQAHLEELIETGLGTSLRGRVAVQGRMVCAKLNGTDERVDVEWMMVPILKDGDQV
ncbi:hypothetical protein PG996_002873 [Apiospora saccharicola]|uniref:Ecp2 effector protein domain-containing protein n=1 Tax=Apiospora saccharicola TaxID=335842 RepID=A0ABR1WKS2_9PEZI